MKTAITIYSDSEHYDAVLALITGSKTTSSKKKTTSRSSGGADTLAEVKKAMNAAKKEHGEDFVLEVLEQVGKVPEEKSEQTIGRQLSACDVDNHEAMIEAFEAGPTEEDEVDADAVRAAIKAHAKENGKGATKKILKKYDIPINDLDDLEEEDEEVLTELMQKLS